MKKQPEINFHGEINLDRLAWILGKVKSKQLGYPVTAKIRPVTDNEKEELRLKEAQ